MDIQELFLWVLIFAILGKQLYTSRLNFTVLPFFQSLKSWTADPVTTRSLQMENLAETKSYYQCVCEHNNNALFTLDT